VLFRSVVSLFLPAVPLSQLRSHSAQTMESPQLPTMKEENIRRKVVDDEEGMIEEFNDYYRPSEVQLSTANNPTDGQGYGVKGRNSAAMLEVIDGGGVYMPPAKRRQMLEAQRAAMKDDSNLVQRQTWQDQKRVVHGTINRLNESTIKPLIHDLFQGVNILRLRGVLARSLLQAAATSPLFSNVYAALVAVLNTKLPEVGELVVKRAILGFRRHYRRKEKAQCLAMAIFIGHLFHQAVVHELLVLQILTLLLDGDPTDDSVEVAVQFLTVIGQALLEVSPAGVRAVLERLRALLHEGNFNKRVEYKIEQLLKMRKNGFRDHPPIPETLDLVERDDQITFELSLDDEDISKDDHLDVFRLDDDYEENEKIWTKIQGEILGTGGDDDSDGDDETDNDDGDDESVEEEVVPDQELAVIPTKSQDVVIQDLSEADLIHLRRQIYLTIMSSASFEECTHKLTKVNIPPGRESELINMIIECTSQERTFLRYYGLISARFCLLDDRWKNAFMEAFENQYMTIHRLETNKLRNVAKLFAHLLHTDSVPWSCLKIIHLNEEETTSSSRIFVKILIQEMAEAMGIARLKERFEPNDPELLEWYKGMFPRDNVRNTRYAINFFTSIGLGPLTDGLREFLKNAPKMILAHAQLAATSKNDDTSVSSSSSSSSSSLSTSSSSSSESDSSSSSSSSSSYSRRRRRRRRSPSSSSSDSDNDSSSSRSSRSKRRKGHEDSSSSDSSESEYGRQIKKKGFKERDRKKTTRIRTSEDEARDVPKMNVNDDKRKHSPSLSYSSDESRDGEKNESKKRRI